MYCYIRGVSVIVKRWNSNIFVTILQYSSMLCDLLWFSAMEAFHCDVVCAVDWIFFWGNICINENHIFFFIHWYSCVWINSFDLYSSFCAVMFWRCGITTMAVIILISVREHYWVYAIWLPIVYSSSYTGISK
jgi:hypothetical protein